ncbi:MAG: type 4a pilus biogenesis protein PilO [Desulfobulbaceae bacterium]|nr:type 4a pilus biogenesis protein PilO [Desulfobulbaceae bacterium]
MATGSALSKFDTFLNEKYIPLEKKVKIIILIFLILLPIALFYFFLYKPGADKIQTLNKQKASMKTELMQAQKASRDLPKYRADMEETQKRFDAMAVLLPKKKEIPDLLRNISDLGKGAGLDFLSFKPGSEIPQDFYSEIPVDISIRGPYHNMGFFLDHVSKLDRIVTVNNIKMGSPKEDSGEMLLNSTCRLMTYRFTNVQVQKPDQKKK